MELRKGDLLFSDQRDLLDTEWVLEFLGGHLLGPGPLPGAHPPELRQFPDLRPLQNHH
jgi:hypothetical protein